MDVDHVRQRLVRQLSSIERNRSENERQIRSMDQRVEYMETGEMPEKKRKQDEESMESPPNKRRKISSFVAAPGAEPVAADTQGTTHRSRSYNYSSLSRHHEHDTRFDRSDATHGHERNSYYRRRHSRDREDYHRRPSRHDREQRDDFDDERDAHRSRNRNEKEEEKESHGEGGEQTQMDQKEPKEEQAQTAARNMVMGEAQKKRTRRMFGFLQSTLQQCQKDLNRKSAAALRRQKVEERIQKQKEEESRKVDEEQKQKLEQQLERKKQASKHLEQRQEEVAAILKTLEENEEDIKMSHFLKTEFSRPPICFLPFKLTTSQQETIDKKKARAEEKQKEIQTMLEAAGIDLNRRRRPFGAKENGEEAEAEEPEVKKDIKEEPRHRRRDDSDDEDDHPLLGKDEPKVDVQPSDTAEVVEVKKELDSESEGEDNKNRSVSRSSRSRSRSVSSDSSKG